MKNLQFYKLSFPLLIFCLGIFLMGFGNPGKNGQSRLPPADTLYSPDYVYNLNVVYFIPSDRQPDSAYHQRVSKFLLDGQEFYRTWMNHWGFGDKSYGLLKDTALNLVKLTLVHGMKQAAEYSYASGSSFIQNEIGQYYVAHPDEKYSNQTLVIICASDHDDAADRPFFGLTGNNWCFAIDYPGLDADFAAHSTAYVGGLLHELGHGLGLPHDGGIKSENIQFGTSLMGSGNQTYGETPTYLPKADCAILNSAQVFNNSVRSDWYTAVNDTIKRLNAYYSNGNIIVSGKFSTNSTAAINYVNYYNQQDVTGGDYRSSVWSTPVIGSDSFYVSMPYSDFSTSGDNNYKLTVMLVHDNGKTFSKSYSYSVVGGVPQIDIHPGFFVKLTGLTDGIVMKKDSLTLIANAEDDNGIDNVKIFINGLQKAALTEAPYEWNWNNIAPGKYSIVAKAFNISGMNTSDSLTVTILNDSVMLVSAIADAFVQNGESDSVNFGTVPKLIVKNDPNVGYSRISYLKFDVSNYADAIANARLVLPILASNSGVVNTQWQLFYCTDDSWTETGITWNNKPDNVSLIGTQPGKIKGTVEWDVSNQLKTEINGDKMLTLAIVSTVANTSSDVSFNSKEVTIDYLQPQIVINDYPLVTLSQPLNNEVFEIGDSIVVKANVLKSNGVANVKFVVNGVEKATINQAPYEWNWTNMQTGTYIIQAKSTDSSGSSTLSYSATIKVKDTSGIIEPIADAFVRDGSSASANFGTQAVLTVKNDPNSAGFSRISYLKFNLSDYTNIDTAKLQLSIKGSNTNVTATQWQLWKCDNDNWAETGITWNDRPAAATLIGTLPGKKSGVAEWDITDIVRAETNADKTLTLTIISTVPNATSDVSFHSREQADISLRPKLIIEAPPVVSLVQPVNNDTLAERSAMIIEANASDDKKIAYVKFFINGEEKANVTQPPYEWNWENLQPGTYSIRAKATDNSGLSTLSDSITVYVKDTTDPVIVSPGNITVNNDTGTCGAIVNYTAPVGTDNYSAVTTSLTQGFTSGAVFPVGTTTVTYTATDIAGNTSSCSFTVTVNDAETPTITVPASISIYTNVGQNFSTINLESPATNDNCGVATITNNAPAIFPVGNTIVIWVVTDVNGNTNTAEQTVTVHQRSSFGPVTLFVGVTNSDNNGRRVDLQADLYLNGTLIGSGTLANQQVSGNALNNSKKLLIPLNVAELAYSASDQLQLKISVRRVGGSGNFGVRLWYNADSVKANSKGFSRISRTTPDGPPGDFLYLLDNFLLDASAGDGGINVALTATTTYQEVGTWSTTSGAQNRMMGNSHPLIKDWPTNNNLSVDVFPNPATDVFTLNFHSPINATLSVRIFDITGRLVKAIENHASSVIRLGDNLKSGIYNVEIVQGNSRKVVKLLKL